MTVTVDPSEFQRPFGDCEEEVVVPTESKDHHIVFVQEQTAPGTEEVKREQPDTPAIGKWYYVRSYDKDGKLLPERWLGCVVKLGSNYVKLEDPSDEGTMRIHDDEFWARCEFVENPEQLLRGNAERCRRELDGLMEDVKQLTSKLGVAPSQALGSGEAQATSLVLGATAPAKEYKTALVKAKEETLPELFKQIQAKSKEYATWLSAGVVPMKAEAAALQPAIKRVEDRIFSVELYAGLCEEVDLIKGGEPAALTEPVHLFQRRLYMDEECLANFDAGGMDFRTIAKFDRWLCRKDNFARIFPFPRTIVAFQVRHHKKDRALIGFRSFLQMMEDERLDKLTFLYIRNGERLYWLSTAIEFGEKLFPDLDHPVLSAGEGKLYANLQWSKKSIITEAQYQAKVADEAKRRADYKRRVAEENKKPKKDRQHVWGPDIDSFDSSSNYQPFTRESVQYDDIAKYVRGEMEKHNRIVLVLQGLLDRSPALHPHPPWKLFDAAGFGQALVLHRDADRVLVAGEKPSFEAYRAKLNASITVGSLTIGQQEAWLRYEGKKESARRDRSRAWGEVDYRPEKWQPEGDSGPGRFARVARLDRSGHAHYRWTKERQQGDGPPVGRKYGCKVSRVLNIDAYQPGDYKIFLADPRTREEYLQWAPFLLAAEKYKAGKYELVPPLAEPPKPKSRPATLGMSRYAYRQMQLGFLGRAVRLRAAITTRGNNTYKKDSLWRVTRLDRQGFEIEGIDAKGEIEWKKEDGCQTHVRGIRSLSHRDFYVDSSIPDDPKYQYKPEKRERAPAVDEEDD